MLKVKLSMGEVMPPLILLMDEDMVPLIIVAVAIALKLPERLLLMTLAWLLFIPPHPARTKTKVADSRRLVLCID
jgi:hypothetical protein